MMEPYQPMTRCLFPVAGLGTRFLPATKKVPKEMIPLVDRPLVHYGVTEAVESGCSHILFVIGHGKSSIIDYFSMDSELEIHLEKQGKGELAAMLREIPNMARFSYTLQHRPLGLGDAVLRGEDFCNTNHFGLILPDDVMRVPLGTPPVLAQLEAVRQRYGGSVIALEKVPLEEAHRYGVVQARPVEQSEGLYRIEALVEKPSPGTEPSNLAVMGRYILSPKVFKYLRAQERGRDGEVQLTDALQKLLKEEVIWGYEYSGTRLDCGTLEGWIRANLQMIVADPTLREIVRDVVKDIL